LEPGHLLLDMDVQGRHRRARIVEQSDIEIDLARIAVGLVGDRRAAAAAMRAPDARRRSVGHWLSAHVAEHALVNAHEGRDRAGGVAAAALAMAVHNAYRRAPV